MYIRVIPRLDIKGPNLVKGIHLEGLRVLGKPWDFAYKYYQEGADELIYIDAVASLYGRNNLTEIVKKTAERIFIPLTVGGGVRSVEDIRSLLRAGADKVAINTAAVHRPELIAEGARAFGSQCIVSSIQAKKINGQYIAMTDNAREVSGKRVFDIVRQLVDNGAGEILLTSVDMEGTGRGYDIELVSKVAESVEVPVIACGGCGKREHFPQVIKEGKADAICASSVFHYKYIEQHVDPEQYEDEGNIEFIKQRRDGLDYMKDRIERISIEEAKIYLNSAGIACRKSSSS